MPPWLTSRQTHRCPHTRTQRAFWSVYELKCALFFKPLVNDWLPRQTVIDVPAANSAVWLCGNENTEPSDICRFVGEHHHDVASRRFDEVDTVRLGRVSTAGSRRARHQPDKVLHQVAVVEWNGRIGRHLIVVSARTKSSTPPLSTSSALIQVG